MTRKYLLEEMTWPEAKKAFEGDTVVVVIPIGSTEQHGPHLPVGTDFLVAQELARRLGARADVIVTPTIPIGFAKYHNSFPGTLSMTEETLARLLIEMCEDLLRYGTTHILFVDGHGGNLTALRQCGEVLRDWCVPMAVACWWQMTQVVDPEWLAIGHADWIETAAVLAIDERLVDLQVAKRPNNKPFGSTMSLDTLDVARFKGGTFMVNLVTADVSDTGDIMEYGLTAAKNYDIEPTAASKAMGERILEGLADYLAEFVAEFRTVTLPPIEEIGPLGIGAES